MKTRHDVIVDRTKTVLMNDLLFRYMAILIKLDPHV